MSLIPTTRVSQRTQSVQRGGGSTVLVPLLYELCSLAYGELTITLQYVCLNLLFAGSVIDES
jgi:hypothetical protein